jgi:hypothetical protein
MERMKVLVPLVLSAALMIAVPAAARSKSSSHAKVSMKAARATALARVPGGKVRSAELEREHGKLIYSFDIRVPGKPGIEEVHVSAINGKVLSMAHEGRKAERKESRQERHEAPKGHVGTKSTAVGY